MPRLDSQFVKWLLIGAVAAAMADAILYPAELLVIAQRDGGSLSAELALSLIAAMVVTLTVLALLVIGERTPTGLIIATAAAAIAYFIGATHLASLSLGVSVATLGDRLERSRQTLGRVNRLSRVNRARPAPAEPRPATRRRRRRRR